KNELRRSKKEDGWCILNCARESKMEIPSIQNGNPRVYYKLARRLTTNHMVSTRSFAHVLFCLVAAARLASAQTKVIISDPDDRLTSVPVNWWTYSGQSTQDISNTIAKQGARIVDISVDQVSPTLLFTVTYVQNTGPYYKGFGWYAGIGAADLASAI